MLFCLCYAVLSLLSPLLLFFFFLFITIIIILSIFHHFYFAALFANIKITINTFGLL